MSSDVHFFSFLSLPYSSFPSFLTSRLCTHKWMRERGGHDIIIQVSTAGSAAAKEPIVRRKKREKGGEMLYGQGLLLMTAPYSKAGKVIRNMFTFCTINKIRSYYTVCCIFGVGPHLERKLDEKSQMSHVHRGNRCTGSQVQRKKFFQTKQNTLKGHFLCAAKKTPGGILHIPRMFFFPPPSLPSSSSNFVPRTHEFPPIHFKSIFLQEKVENSPFSSISP